MSNAYRYSVHGPLRFDEAVATFSGGEFTSAASTYTQVAQEAISAKHVTKPGKYVLRQHDLVNKDRTVAVVPFEVKEVTKTTTALVLA